ncbi:hypothetical protein RHECNPAF_13600103 [Rhizobium etli CNPAF512]|nr:hypothetical protein RHECNPAF_13600103 [Rhizobium etli CNPAF512]
MVEEFARMLRPAMTVEIGRRRGSGKTLPARADRYCDHILLQPLVITDAGIASGSKHIDEALLGDDLEANIGIGGEEWRNDSWQHQARRADRYIEPQRTGRPVAKSVDHVERGLHLSQGRAKPFQQALACFRWNDATRRAVQQSDPELSLEATHRLAQEGGAAAAAARRLAKTAGPRHGDKGIEIAQICFHCSPLRTACTDCSRLSYDPPRRSLGGVAIAETTSEVCVRSSSAAVKVRCGYCFNNAPGRTFQAAPAPWCSRRGGCGPAAGFPVSEHPRRESAREDGRCSSAVPVSCPRPAPPTKVLPWYACAPAFLPWPWYILPNGRGFPCPSVKASTASVGRGYAS